MGINGSIMKFALFSDIHNEFRKEWFIPKPDADVIVFCGDVINGKSIIDYYQTVLDENPGKQIVFINGNHEYYGHEKIFLDETVSEFFKDNSNIHFLNNEIFEFENVFFIGSTLWTNFNKSIVSEHDSYNRLSDFRQIRVQQDEYSFAAYVKPEHMRRWFNEGINFISQSVRACPSDKTPVILTHFVPSKNIEHSRIPSDSLTDYFNPDCETDIAEFGRETIWCYGHNHCNEFSGNMIHNATFYTNQLGYPREGTGGDDIGLIIEV